MLKRVFRFVIPAYDCKSCGKVHEHIEVKQMDSESDRFVVTCPVTKNTEVFSRIESDRSSYKEKQ